MVQHNVEYTHPYDRSSIPIICGPPHAVNGRHGESGNVPPLRGLW